MTVLLILAAVVVLDAICVRVLARRGVRGYNGMLIAPVPYRPRHRIWLMPWRWMGVSWRYPFTRRIGWLYYCDHRRGWKWNLGRVMR